MELEVGHLGYIEGFSRNNILRTALEDKLEQKKVEARNWFEGY